LAHDLVLSSGFLAFARHNGVIAALQQAGVAIDGVCGTSSGAVVGALFAAGYDAEAIERALSDRRPYSLMRPSPTPWRGLARLDAFVRHLESLLPATFADLQRPLALGVVAPGGRHLLLTEGPLAPAVAASCAMPGVFEPIEVGGTTYRDGGAADRLALEPWRRWRPGKQAIAHQVRRTAGKDQPLDLEGITLLQTPRSGASFWSLGDYPAQVRETAALVRDALDPLQSTDRTGTIDH
jgi:predicted acylesterase/phospholipase RssA